MTLSTAASSAGPAPQTCGQPLTSQVRVLSFCVLYLSTGVWCEAVPAPRTCGQPLTSLVRVYAAAFPLLNWQHQGWLRSSHVRVLPLTLGLHSPALPQPTRTTPGSPKPGPQPPCHPPQARPGSSLGTAARTVPPPPTLLTCWWSATGGSPPLAPALSGWRWRPLMRGSRSGGSAWRTRAASAAWAAAAASDGAARSGGPQCARPPRRSMARVHLPS